MDGISTMMSEHNSELPASMFDEIVDVDDESVRMSDSMVESIITCARFIGGRERCDVDREARAPNMACTLLQAQDAFLRSPESTCHLNLFGMPGCTEDPQTIFHAAILILTYHPLVAALEEAGEKGVWLLQTLVATVVCQGVLLGRSRACARADTFLAIALEHISTQAVLDTARTAKDRPHELGMRTPVETRKLKMGASWFSHGLRNQRPPDNSSAAKLLTRLLSGHTGLTTGFNLSNR